MFFSELKRRKNEAILDGESIENLCRQIEEHLHSLYRLIGDVKDIGCALLVSNPRLPDSNYNHATRVSVAHSEICGLIEDVVRYYEPMELNPCFVVSPTTRPKAFANSLLKAGFKLVEEEDVMVYRGINKDFKLNPEVKVAIDDGSLTDVWIDVSMKGFGAPTVWREALKGVYRKASSYKGSRGYLGYFQRKPAGCCGFVSINNVGGIVEVATAPEYRSKGVATALLHKAIADSLSMENNLLYLTTGRGSDAERLYASLGFEVAYTFYRYEKIPRQETGKKQ